jgi:hypothetical protein
MLAAISQWRESCRNGVSRSLSISAQAAINGANLINIINIGGA